MAHQNEINRGIDPRHTQRSVSATPRDGTNHLPIAPKGSNGAMPEIVLRRISDEAPFFIPKPTDPEDKHSIHFLAYEYVEFYVKRQRESSREVVRILMKDVLPYWQMRDARTISSREIIESPTKVHRLV